MPQNKKILFISEYSFGKYEGGNNNVYRQAFALKKRNIDVEILCSSVDRDKKNFFMKCINEQQQNIT